MARRESVSREEVLSRAEEELGLVDQWIRLQNFSIVLIHLHKCVGLLELLEIADCGSTGGFDKKQPMPRPGLDGLRDRLEWLRREKGERRKGSANSRRV